MDHPLSLSGERHVALEDDEGGAARGSLRLPNLCRAGAGPGGNELGGRTGIACACSGGPGSGGNAVALLIAGLLVLRRRRS